MEPIVQYKDVHKSFGDTHVLKGINLDIRPSEKIAVIGPSGSGKTTIIRLLMTLEEPTKGDIYVAGKNLWKISAGQRKTSCRSEKGYRHGFPALQSVSP